MATNISTLGRPEEHDAKLLSKLLGLIGQPARIQILLVIGSQEACVCHLEAVLGMRQASISQHLMVLRKAGLVATQRDGRHIFYCLHRPEVIDLLEQAASLAGMDPARLQELGKLPAPGCPCPKCSPEMDPKLVCRTPR